MSGGPLLGSAVHVDRPNLHLKHKTIAITDAGVKTLISVGLGFGDIVLESKGFGFKEPVDRVEREIAVVAARHDDAKGDEVVNLFDEQIFLVHLSPHPRDVFGAALHRHRGNSIAGKRGFDDPLSPGAPLGAGIDQGVELALNPAEGIWIEDLQRRIFDQGAELHFTEFLCLYGIELPYLERDITCSRVTRMKLFQLCAATPEITP